jgi:hypothetical protein
MHRDKTSKNAIHTVGGLPIIPRMDANQVERVKMVLGIRLEAISLHHSVRI